MTYISPEAVLVTLLGLCCIVIVTVIITGVFVLKGRYVNDSNRPRD